MNKANLNWKISIIFVLYIPDSFLPFPKKILNSAFQEMSNYYKKTGNVRGLELLSETSMLLIMYVDDKIALKNAFNNFSDDEYCVSVATTLKEFQRDWILTQ